MSLDRSHLPDVTVVTWLASYPRSGNTLLRVILKRCFGLSSQSIYHDAEFSDPELRSMVGHESVGSDPHQFIARARGQGRKLCVKTHELPPSDQHPAIYIVRDGRSAVVSHAHYLREVIHRDISLTEVIQGKAGISWSQHVRAWTMPARPRTLVVRYEDLAIGRTDTLSAISAFIRRPVIRDFDIGFDGLHGLDPIFFRRGCDEDNISELDGQNLDLFDRLHGETLRAIGYDKRPMMTEAPAWSLRAEQRSP